MINTNQGRIMICLTKNNLIFLTNIVLLFVSLFLGIKSANAEITYIHTDYLGSVSAKSNEAGQVTERFHYAPFGLSDDPNGLNNKQSYTGHVYDNDSQLVYMQARYYDPVIGRFYSNDPVDTKSHLYSTNGIHGFNRYAYANNNPYRYIDPTGMNSQNVIPTYLQGMSAEDIEKMLKEEKSKPKNQQNKQMIQDLQKAQKGLGVRNKQKRKNNSRGGGKRAVVVALLGLIADLFTDDEAEASENEDSTQEPTEEDIPEQTEPTKKED